MHFLADGSGDKDTLVLIQAGGDSGLEERARGRELRMRAWHCGGSLEAWAGGEGAAGKEKSRGGLWEEVLGRVGRVVLGCRPEQQGGRWGVGAVNGGKIRLGKCSFALINSSVLFWTLKG